MRGYWTVLFALGLSGCVVTTAPQGSVRGPLSPAPVAAGHVLPPAAAARRLTEVVNRVEPVAEAMCRARIRKVRCDYLILLDVRADQPPNAYQTLDRRDRPVIIFTSALIAEARNADELAFVLGHEAAHHIAGHIPRAQEKAVTGALMAGVLATIGGADEQTIRNAQDIGAQVGARTYSKDFELEADALGTEIAYRAGFDPERGAAFFGRLPDPGNRFLGSHPPNARRIDTVRQTMARLR